MNTGTRKQVLFGLVCAGFVVAMVGFSYGYFQDCRAAAQAETEELSACRQLAEKIEAAPVVSGKQTGVAPVSLDLPREIAAAAARAGLPGDCIEGIRPDPIRKSVVGGRMEKPTRLSVRHVTLNQILGLLVNLHRPREGLCIEKLHIDAETGPAAANTWSAEALLVYSSATPDGPALLGTP